MRQSEETLRKSGREAARVAVKRGSERTIFREQGSRISKRRYSVKYGSGRDLAQILTPTLAEFL